MSAPFSHIFLSYFTCLGSPYQILLVYPQCSLQLTSCQRTTTAAWIRLYSIWLEILEFNSIDFGNMILFTLKSNLFKHILTVKYYPPRSSEGRLKNFQSWRNSRKYIADFFQIGRNIIVASVFFWLWTERYSILYIIKRKTITTIIFLSIWKES